MLTELAHDGFNTNGQLVLAHARICNQVCHLTANLLPSEVGVLKFRTADVCAKDRENIGTKGSCMSFEACESRILIHSVPFSEVRHLGC